jgi:electron transport complex protein RnfG
MAQGKKDSVMRMVIVLTVTCLVAGLCLSFTYNKTKDDIAHAKLDAQLKSVQKVLPSFDGDIEVKTVMIDGEEKTFYLGRKDGMIVGAATQSASLGYGGTLNLLVGVDPEGVMTGVVLLEHQETPGLGAKAGGDEFLNQFKGKSLVTLSDEVKVKKDGGDIDSITAATITSRAVAHAATKALRLFMENKEEVL